MLIDQFQRQNESQAVLLPDQNALHSLHGAALDADLFTNNQLPVRLNPLPEEVGAEKLDLRIRNGKRPLAVAYDSQNPRRTKNRRPLREVNPCEHIRRKQGLDDLRSLPVLPYVRAFAMWEETIRPGAGQGLLQPSAHSAAR